MDIVHFFEVREISEDDDQTLVGKFELVAYWGERVAIASSEQALEDLEMQLNLLLTDAVEANQDITINS